MSYLTWAALGLVSGIIAKFIMPGRENMGWIMTTLLGIGGAFVGGYGARFLGFGGVDGFNLPSLAVAGGGAIVLLVVYKFLTGRE